MSDVTKTSRDVSELAPNAQLAIRAFFYECLKANINVFVTETYRSQARQNYLYEQGRTRSGKIVTWTKSSRHTSKMAWDIAVCPPNGLYDTATLNKAGAIARKLGITWGGDWAKNIDRPHFEINANWRLPIGYDAKVIAGVKVPSTSAGKVVLTVSDTVNKEPIANEEDSDMLNETGRIAARNIIKRAVKDKTFTDAHTDVDKYDDKKLISFALAYVDRKVK